MWIRWAKQDLDPNLGPCLIIALTWQQGPVLYKGGKGINDAARPPEGGPAEAGGFSTLEHWSPGTNARQPAENPLHEPVARWAIFDERRTRRTSVAQVFF